MAKRATNDPVWSSQAQPPPLFLLFLPLRKYLWLSTLAGALVLVSGQVWADNECGTTSTVACNGDFQSGIRYRNQDGLTLTAGDTSGPDTITVPSNGAGIRVESRNNSTGSLSVEVRPSVEINQNTGSNGRDGVFVLQRGTGSVRVQIHEGVRLGDDGARLTDHGIFVGGMNNDEQLTIINDGNIFVDGRPDSNRLDSQNRPTPRFGAGINADRNGAGGIEIIHGGEIDSKQYGIRSWHGGAGSTVITNNGRITSEFRGIEARNASTGDITITNNGRIVSGDWGIFARQDGVGGAINILSNGNIETTGTDKHGIYAEVRANAANPVTVTVRDGTIQSTGSGVTVNSINGLGPVTVSLIEGSIGGSSSRVGGNGLVARIGAANNGELLKISSTGKIFSEGAGINASRVGAGNIEIFHGGQIDALGRGINTSHDGGSGAIQVTTHRDSMISSALEGIYAQHSGTGDIRITHAGGIRTQGDGIRDGIHVRTETGAVEITHEGRIDSTGHGIFARRNGAATQGGITINSRGDITATRGYRREGISALNWGPKSSGSITVNHEGGTIEAHRGIVVRSSRSSSSTSTITPAADYAPEGTVPDKLVVNLTGGQIIARSAEYDPSLEAARSEHQAGWRVRRLISSTFEGPIGVSLDTIDTDWIGQQIAAGDKSSMEITDEVRMQFRAVLQAAKLFEGSPGSEFNLGNLSDPRNLVKPSSSDDLPGDLSTDAALDAYLEANGEVLSKFLEYTLSAKEAAVVDALFTGGDVEAALTALPAIYTDAYKNRVRWLAKSHNEADIEINVGEGYRIVSGGDGIRAGHRVLHDNSGAIAVTVRKGAIVTAERYGIRIGNAGLDDRGTPDRTDDILDQTVTVEGEVRSTGTDGVGVYMEGGGRLMVGPAGRIIAASGVAVQATKNPMYDNADAPRLRLTLELDGRPMSEVLGGEIVNDDGETRLVVNGVLLYDDAADDVTGQWIVNGARDVSARKVDRRVNLLEVYAPRAMLYEGLPGLLLRLDGGVPGQLPEEAAWAQVEYGTGKGKPDHSSTGADYDHDRIEVAAGISRELDEDVSGSLWLRRVQSEAELDAETGEGELDLRGWGAGAAWRWRGPDGWEVVGQLSYTDYDVDASSWRGALARDVDAEVLSVGLEAKYGEFRAGGVALRPRAWARHTRVEVDDFTDALGVQARFSDESRTHAGLGLRADVAESDHSWYGAVDVERLLGGEETAVTVSRERLESEAERTRVWIGFGGERRRTRITLRGGVRLGDPGGENQEWVASLSLGGQF